MKYFSLLLAVTLLPFILKGRIYPSTHPDAAFLPLDSNLIKRVSAIYLRDMYYRKGSDSFFMANWKLQDSLDKVNQKIVSNIIDSFGYPGYSIVGQILMNKCFLVIQHADSAYQNRYLKIVIDAADKGELGWGSVALLIDRIKVSKGEKQIYGSQLSIDSAGNYHLEPVENEMDLNKRRKSVGLEPIEEYLMRWDILYIPPKD
jgi:hypothetical protein